MSKNTRKVRVAKVIANELTEHQRKVIVGYYIEQKTMTQLAQELGVNKSTVSRTIKRGEERLKRCLAY